MTRRLFLACVTAAVLAGAIPATVFGQEVPAVIFVLRRSDRGDDYKAFDIVQVIDAFRADGTLRGVVLPPADPFALVKVNGITLQEALPLMRPDLNPDGTIRNKRSWGFRAQSIPLSARNFFLSNWFVGFGSLEDQAIHGDVVIGDTVLLWTDVQTWIRPK